MEQSLVKIVSAGGMLMIGVFGGGQLQNPRVIVVNQGPGGSAGVSFLQLIGFPKMLELGETAFSYECQDENVLTGYRENVTGLSIAKAVPGNLVQKLRH